MKIAQYIDHTLLAPWAEESDILKLCEEGMAYSFKTVCVSGTWVKFCAALLEENPVKLAAVIGFPHGNPDTTTKCFEAESYFKQGAAELDVVMNIGWMLSGKIRETKNELVEIRKAVPEASLKLILETCYLDTDHKRLGCQLAAEAGWDFVKTSTGFGSRGATLEDIVLMRSVVGDTMGVKASGGIRDYETARKYVMAGASRIGTSSGPAIVRGELESHSR